MSSNSAIGAPIGGPRTAADQTDQWGPSWLSSTDGETPSQRAIAAAKAENFYVKQAKERQRVRKGKQPGASPVNLPELNRGDSRDAAGQAFGVSCRRCGATEFVDVPIHDGESIRRDCAQCGRTVSFPTWQPADSPSPVDVSCLLGMRGGHR